MAAYTTIDDPEAYFQTVIWTGDGSDGRTITLPGDTNMQPDFIWSKNRGDGEDHCLMDVVRTFASGKAMRTNGHDEEGGVGTAARGWTEATSDGFTVEDGSSNANLVNDDGNTYVAWCWKESATSGFDIVAYTGTGSAHTESHSLSAVPHLMIVKNRSDSDAWRVYHHGNTAAPETDYLVLNTTAATADDSAAWNDTAPTSSVFSVGTSDQTNENTDSFIAYLFSEIQGFSKFGSYTGNGNADGTFVYTGFRPAFVIQKATGATEQWTMYTNKTLGYNPDNNFIYPNANTAEQTDDEIDFLSNGFKWRSNSGRLNSSGGAYIYMAWAEAPLVNSNGVPCNAR